MMTLVVATMVTQIAVAVTVKDFVEWAAAHGRNYLDHKEF